MTRYTLPDWVKAGAKFRLFGRVYHVRGVVDDIAVLDEWWRTKQRWNHTAEDALYFDVMGRHIEILKRGK